MSEPVQPFISELIRAANEIDKLSKLEQASLLRRAASTIRDYRELINRCNSPENDRGQGDIVHTLNVMAETIEFARPAAVAAAFLEAAQTIKTGQILLDAKRAHSSRA
jgi:acyl-CoA reductase-like NAD-dependent aldehyde dehydrogenase